MRVSSLADSYMYRNSNVATMRQLTFFFFIKYSHWFQIELFRYVALCPCACESDVNPNITYIQVLRCVSYTFSVFSFIYFMTMSVV